MIARSAAYRPDAFSDPLPEADGSAAYPPSFAPALAGEEPPRGRVLIVEDQVAAALELQRTLRDAGYRIVGPAGSQGEVERLVRRGGLDAAVIDVDSRRSAPFAVADWLAAAGVPFAFLVGDAEALPHEHAHRPRIGKPWSAEALCDTVEQMVEGRPGATPGQVVPWPRLFPQL
jgi:CheY-like chemotaxis protein